MNFAIFFAGTAIEHFTALTQQAADKYTKQRYKDNSPADGKCVAVNIDDTPEEIKTKIAESQPMSWAMEKITKEEAMKAAAKRMAAEAFQNPTSGVVPRATDKQVKVGKPKHRPDAATIAARQVKDEESSGKQPTERQKRDRRAGAAKVEDILDKLTTKVITDPTTLPADKAARLEAIVEAIKPNIPYNGPMLALRSKLKQGQYKKAANGQPSCGDDVALLLGQLEPVEVIQACLIAMDIKNPYLHLNIGQQSMNLRNKLRGMLKRGEFGMGVVHEAVEVIIEGHNQVGRPDATET